MVGATGSTFGGVVLELSPPVIASLSGHVTGDILSLIPGVALGLASLLGIAVAALASLAGAALVAVYLLRNKPGAFLSFRKLRPEPDREDDADEFE